MMGTPPFPAPTVAPQFRDGTGWKQSHLNKWTIAGGESWAMLEGRLKHEHTKGYEIMSDVKEAYKLANEEINNAQTAYQAIIKKFRETIRNDLTSISASANRVEGETNKLNQNYKHVINLFSSSEMEKAISNAERLAVALEAISKVQKSNITFAVLGNKPPE